MMQAPDFGNGHNLPIVGRSMGLASGLPPPGPDPGEPDPEETIRRAKLGPGRRSLVHGELLVQGEVLQGELAVAAADEREESKEVEQEGDHRAGILSGSEPTDQPLGQRTEFWRRTASGP
jgi:hypothetical protein